MNVPRVISRGVGAMLALALLAGPVHAQVNFLGPGSFTPDAPAVTFDEFALGTVNPSISFLGIPGLGDVTLDFGGHFLGQTTQTVGCCAVGITGSPTGPLALDPDAPDVFTTNDGATGATSPVLSGSPTFNGPISILFSQPVAAVGLKGGFFNAVGSTFLNAFDVNGNSLGSVFNTVTGFEFFGAVTASGLNEIAGLSFVITSDEPAGFAIDDVTFGSGQQLVGVPEPSTLLLLVPGLLALALLRKREDGPVFG